MEPNQQLDPPGTAAEEEATPAPAREPFAAQPDKTYFYPEPTRAQRLKLLHHLAPYGELLIVTGETGSGKTTLLEQFMERSHPGWRLCEVVPEPGWGPQPFLEALIRGFDIRARVPDTERGKLDLVIAHCASLKRNGLVAVIAVDDAERLEPGALRVLLDLLTGMEAHDKPLRVILFAAPRLRDTISAEVPGLQERITHTFNLPPFSERETGQYLHHRLKAAGFTGNHPFTDSVVKSIHRSSQGLPAKINELARVVMANNAGGPRPAGTVRRGANGRNLNVIPLGVAAVVLAALALHYIRQPAPPSPAGTPERPAATAPTDAASTVPLALPPDTATNDTAPPLQQAAEVPPLLPSPMQPQPSSPGAPQQVVELPPPLIAGPAAAPPPDEPDGATAVVPRPVQAETASGPTPGEPDRAVAASPPVQAKMASKPAPGGSGGVPVAVSPPPEPPAPTAASAKLVSKGAKAPQHRVAKATPGTAAKPPADAGGTVHDAAWLLSRPAGHYTLQLMATREGGAIPSVIAKSGVEPNRFAHFQILSRGEAWHILTYGDFADQVQATARAAHLPPGLRRFQPWARSMGTLQAAVKQFRTSPHSD